MAFTVDANTSLRTFVKALTDVRIPIQKIDNETADELNSYNIVQISYLASYLNTILTTLKAHLAEISDSQLSVKSILVSHTVERKLRALLSSQESDLNGLTVIDHHDQETLKLHKSGENTFQIQVVEDNTRNIIVEVVEKSA